MRDPTIKKNQEAIMRNGTMIKILFVMVACLGYSLGASGKDLCSNKTLKGTYIYSSQGYYEGEPYSESGMESYDGAGNVLARYTDSLGRTNASDGATYLIGSDCQGTVTYASGSVYNIYVNPKGDSFTYTLTSGGGAVSGENKRISKKLIIK